MFTPFFGWALVSFAMGMFERDVLLTFSPVSTGSGLLVKGSYC